MLLIDGVRYELWTPPSEKEFERVVKEHTQEIFGEQTIYLDKKQKLKSLSGIGSIPDGYVISFREPPCWYICEVELHTHPLYEHIVPQMTKFINGVKSFETQREIINALDREISGDPLKEALVRSKISPVEVYRFISDLISKLPILVIVIDQKTKELEEVCDSLPIEVKIVELKTFTRQEIGLSVHAHLFEPLYRVTTPKVTIVSERGGVVPVPTPYDTLEVIIRNPTFINFHLFMIPKGRRSFFPGYRMPFTLEADIGEIKTYVTSARKGTQVGDPDAGAYIQRNLVEWYRRHPTIKVGDKVAFRVIEPGKKYRLEFLK